MFRRINFVVMTLCVNLDMVCIRTIMDYQFQSMFSLLAPALWIRRIKDALTLSIKRARCTIREFNIYIARAQYHYRMMSMGDQIHPWRFISPANQLFVRQLIQDNNNGNTKAPRYWPFVRGIHRWWPVMRKAFPCHDVIMTSENMPPNLIWEIKGAE